MKKQTKDITNGIISGFAVFFIVEILKAIWNTIISKIDFNSSIQSSLESIRNNPLRMIIIATLFAFIGVVVNFYKIKKQTKDTRKAGVIDEGINSTYINCEGIGPDAGLINKGKGLKSINSKWISRDEVAEVQKQRFEENKKNHFDSRNSNK